ncbi:MAG: thioredoxin-dependent thiol peroxidase [Cytophagaceae bacterium]|jgi:peroxiredoxin Q/BCP|nr:thioredoxin-dependent thiol peroxidase [Cytophagaceae bacterium]
MKLKIGDKAPDFTGMIEDGSTLSLKSLKGTSFVLYFYPKDNTPGCTAQACNLRDNITQFKKKGFTILGVSSDSISSHLKFKTKFELPFSLIADEDQSIQKAYGVWGEKSMYGKTYMGTIRTTFVINENGIISDIIEKVNTKEHSAQLLNK